MRRYPVGDLRYGELRAELDRRVSTAQIAATAAQVKSTWYQLGAVVMMFVTTAPSVFVQWWLVTHPP